MKAVIYARTSKETRATEQSNILQRQIAVCYEYASKNGYDVEGVFKEVANGANDSRQELQKLIERATNNKGNISAILVASLDRLARNISDFAHLNDMFRELGIELISATELNEDTATSRLTESMLLAFERYERDIRSEDIRAGIRRRRNLNN